VSVFPKRLYKGREPFLRNKDIVAQKPLFSIERPTAPCLFSLCGIGARSKIDHCRLPVCSECSFLLNEPHEATRESLRLHRLWFTMNNVSCTKYILGHSPAEIQRLMSQAVMLRPITERLLRSAGIEPGMRVLDIGCGAGDVSMLAAELVGSTGSVVGIDRNEIGLPPPLSRRHRTGMRARV
jgi:hypothetical protein